MKDSVEPVILGPTRIVVDLPGITASEALAVIDLLEQVTAQLWSDHGAQLQDQILRDRRRHARRLAYQGELPL